MFYVLLTAFAAAIAIADQLTKALAQQYLTGTTITLIPGWLQLHYITNDGMALSLFRGGRWMFVVLTAVYLALVVYAVAKKLIHKRFELWCLAAITGGAIGNLIDRVIHHYVIDFFYFSLINFPVFNVADIYVTLSAIALIIVMFFYYKEEDFSLIFTGKLQNEKES